VVPWNEAGSTVPVLIDGYNLYYYAKSLYRQEDADLSVAAFCTIVDEWSRQARQKVSIVFDGGAPPALRQNQTRFGSVALKFTGQRTDADAAIEEGIASSTAPKLLHVVSSDHRIRRAARRRGCKVQTSDEFWARMARKLTARKPKPEPREKAAGLLSHELEYWLKVFGLK
jgi:uncharacterized protein